MICGLIDLIAEPPSLIYLNRILKGRELKFSKNLKRLSSGKKLLTDNPAYYAIYTKLEAQIKGLNKIILNNEDMFSYVQYMEGTLSTIVESLQRIRELGVKKLNGIFSKSDREIITGEMKQHYKHIKATLIQAEFNKIKVFKAFLESKEFKDQFPKDKHFKLDNIDMLLVFFIKERGILGAKMNNLKHRIKGKMIEKENTIKAYSLSDTDYSTEITDLKRNHLLMLTNLMLLKMELKRELKK